MKIVKFLLLITILTMLAFVGYNYLPKYIINNQDYLSFASKNQQLIGIWCIEEQCRWFDNNGDLTKPAPLSDGSLVLTIEGPKVEDQLWNNLKKIINSWIIKEAVLHKIKIDKDKQEAVIELLKGPHVFLSLRFDPEVNLQALKKIYYESSSEDIGQISYFDLRVKNRIYYK